MLMSIRRTLILWSLLLLFVGCRTTAAGNTMPNKKRSSGEGFDFRVRSLHDKATAAASNTNNDNDNEDHSRELQDLFLTFSDDGAVRTDEFYLDLFETPVSLDSPESTGIIQTAMNQFLLSEMSVIYTGMNQIDFITSEIIDMKPINDTVVSGGKRRRAATQTGSLRRSTAASPTSRQQHEASKRDLQDVTRPGMEVLMKVYLTFGIKPSPDTGSVRYDMKQVMSNLTYFVSNMTDSLPISSQQHELAGVYEAFRREIPPPALTPPDNDDTVVGRIPDVDTKPDATTTETEIDENGLNAPPRGLTAAIPIVLVAVVLIAFIVFIVFRKRNKSTESSEIASSSVDPNKASALMYMDVENELYSLDRSVETEQSPRNGTKGISPIAEMVEDEASVGYSDSEAGDGRAMSPTRDSVFSGISGADYNNVRSSKSVLTGYTHASGKTIQASNVEKAKKAATPKSSSMIGSLFAFAEGNEDESKDENNDDGRQPPKLTGSDISEGSETEPDQSEVQTLQRVPPERTSTGPWCGVGGYSTASHTPPVSHVLADLEGMESATRSSASTGPSEGNDTKKPVPSSNNIIMYNPFNCNPVLPPSGEQEEEVESTGSSTNLAEAAVVAATGATVAMAAKEALGDHRQSLQRESKASKPASQSDASSPLSRTMPASFSTDSKEYRKPKSAPSSPAGNAKSKRSGLMSGLFNLARGKSPSRPTSPMSPRSNKSGGSRSEPTTPTEAKLGGHWIKSAEKAKIPRRPPISPPRMSGDEDYEWNLSRPSSPEEDERLNVPNHGDRKNYPALADFTSDHTRFTSEHTRSTRRHAGETGGGDGSAMYQASAMNPMDWSYKSDTKSVGDSTISETELDDGRDQYIFKNKAGEILADANLSPRSETTKESLASSRASASRQLMDDLVWLENKIAGVRRSSSALGPIEGNDSMSFVSKDNSEEDDTAQNNSVMSSIVCRDCYAPPGKLHIVIHSTKDGPAVHTVKDGSSLEGHIFPGDLIISVDNVDTRSFTAEQVMKMMASKSDKERKITVLHFEEE